MKSHLQKNTALKNAQANPASIFLRENASRPIK